MDYCYIITRIFLNVLASAGGSGLLDGIFVLSIEQIIYYLSLGRVDSFDFRQRKREKEREGEKKKE